MTTLYQIVNANELHLISEALISDILNKSIYELTLYELKEIGLILAKEQVNANIELHGIMPQVNLAAHAVLEITQRCINLNLPIYS